MTGEIALKVVGSTHEPVAMNAQGYSLEVQAVSPTVTLTDVEGGTEMTVTDIHGSQTTLIPDGAQGPAGYTPVKGVDYFDGKDGAPGRDGVSPLVAVTVIEGGHRITVADAEGEQTADVMDGVAGPQGVQGETGPRGETGNGIERVVLNADYTLTITMTDGTSYTTESIRGAKGDNGYTPVKGVDYTDGADGTTFTPAVSSAGVISWTNDGGKTNPQSVNIKGPQGPAGQDGQDGVSPTVSVTPITGGHRITITDADGVHTADVMDGQDGAAGVPGQDGQDGVSPTITVTDITGGHRVTITDATGQHSFDVMDGEDGQGAVQDVQVNGVSVLQDGVANVPKADASTLGVVCAGHTYGVYGIRVDSNGELYIVKAENGNIKGAANNYRPIVSTNAYLAAFYGLAKAAGSDEKNSTLPVGQYTESAKSAISTMLNGPVTVSGTTPTINALPGIQYVCGEVSTLDITLPASGCVDVVFTSGATPTVLTVTPPTGVTEVKWADGFDPGNLSANATYWLKVIDGKLGVATAWGVQSGGSEKQWNHAHFEVTDASEQTTAFIIPNNEAISEILVKGKALFDSYDGLYIFINDVALLTTKEQISSTNCFFQLYGSRIVVDQWIGRGTSSQWLATPKLLDENARVSNDLSVSNGVGDIKVASRWTNKIYQVGTAIDVYWR